MAVVDNLYVKLRGYFKYFLIIFIMTSVGNLYTNLRGYFKLSFIMAEVGNLYAKFGVTLSIFYNG
jgi:hypothetical protein